MKNVTVTIWIDESSFLPLITSLKILDTLELENKHRVQPHDIKYSKISISNYRVINIPLDLFMRFEYCYHLSKIGK